MSTTRRDLDDVGARVERLLDELAAADPRAAELAEELVRELVGLYGTGLERILELVASTPDPQGLPQVLADDGLVGGLLVLHDLHPVDARTRVAGALDGVRSLLAAHGGDVEVLGVDGGVARVRLTGGGNGCGSSRAALVAAVEAAVRRAAPEVERVEVVGGAGGGVAGAEVVGGAGGRVDADEVGAPRLIPPEALSRRPGARAGTPDADWTAVDVPATLAPQTAAGLHVHGARLALCRLGDRLYAFHDACPGCGASLTAGADGRGLDGPRLACAGCGRCYDVGAGGRASDGSQLTAVPLVEDLRGVRVALGDGVAP